MLFHATKTFDLPVQEMSLVNISWYSPKKWSVSLQSRWSDSAYMKFPLKSRSRRTPFLTTKGVSLRSEPKFEGLTKSVKLIIRLLEIKHQPKYESDTRLVKSNPGVQVP